MTWAQQIAAAYAGLGGEADYFYLYKEIARMRGEALTSTQEATVRKEVERKSRDSENWDGTGDLFYSAGIGSGRWGLRSMQKR